MGKSRVKMATHVPLLVRAVELSEGEILEVGTGYFSTLLLRWLAEMHGRNLTSLESKEYWYKRWEKKPNPFHNLILVDNWDSFDIANKHWGVVLIDHAPSKRRYVEVERVANNADYIVMHDTEPEADKHYHYSKIWHLFKYRYDYTKCKPYSSVVSNFKELNNF